MLRNTLLAGIAAVALGVPGAACAAEQVEIIHWWTSGSEAAALKLLRENLGKQGVAWKDAAIAGGGGDQARTVLQARMAAGSPPTAMQMLGLVVHDWAAQGALGDLKPVAQKEGWDTVLPPALLIAVAHGGQAWQEATVFDGAVISAGGPEFSKKAFIDLDEQALAGPTMQKTFDQLRTIRGPVDPSFSGRDWNLATAMMVNGQAGMQIMGDWSKGEFVNAGQTAGTDFLCFRYPGTQGSVSFNSDSLGIMRVGRAGTDAQYKLASAVMDPQFQEAFNIKKGSIPARSDVPDTNFDVCGKKGIADAKEAAAKGSLMGSMAQGHAAGEAVKGGVYDVVTAYFNSNESSASAVKKLAQAVANAK